jgi:hypothetical protein
VIEEKKDSLEITEEQKPSQPSNEPKKVTESEKLAGIKTKQGRRLGQWGVWLSEQKHALTIANPETDYIGGRFQTLKFTEAESKGYPVRFKKGLTVYFSNPDPHFQLAGFKNQMYILDLNKIEAHPVYKQSAIEQFEKLGYRERTEADVEIIKAKIEVKKKYNEELSKIDAETKRLDKLQRTKKK